MTELTRELLLHLKKLLPIRTSSEETFQEGEQLRLELEKDPSARISDFWRRKERRGDGELVRSLLRPSFR